MICPKIVSHKQQTQLIRIPLTVLFCFLLAEPLSAQFQITEANFPAIGDSLTVIRDAGLPPQTPAPAQAEAIWDYSTIEGGYLEYAYIPIEEAPYDSIFPDANIISQSDTYYKYFQSSKNQLFYLGDGNSSHEGYIYTDSKLEMEFPFDYNDSFTDTYFATYQQSASTNKELDGNVTVTYDSYGTLTTPAGTFENVARVKTSDVSTEVTYFNGQMSSSYTYNRTIYHWYLPESSFPALYVHRCHCGSFITWNWGYDVAPHYEPVGLEDIDAPNDIIIWSGNKELFIKAPAAGSAFLYSLTGQIVDELTISEGANQFDTATLQPGVYVAAVKSGSAQLSAKVIVAAH